MKYRNPWHKPGKPEYGPAQYETNTAAVEYRGYMVINSIAGHVWDVVKDGVCITQMAGPNGARSAIDRLVA